MKLLAAFLAVLFGIGTPRPRALPRPLADALRRNAGLRRSALHCLWKQEPVSRRIYAEWRVEERSGSRQRTPPAADGDPSPAGRLQYRKQPVAVADVARRIPERPSGGWSIHDGWRSGNPLSSGSVILRRRLTAAGVPMPSACQPFHI